MPKLHTIFVCQSCGAQYSRWQGQCTNCQAWNTLVEELQVTRNKLQGTRKSGEGKIIKLSEVERGNKIENERFSSGSSEFDRVLGGGIVPGSVILVAGEPGMGKSTLLTQLALRVGQEQGTRNKEQVNKFNQVLYVCGEESPSQVNLRVRRLLGMNNAKFQMPNLLMLPETDVEVINATTRGEKPKVLIVDSIQTLSSEDLSGMAGSVGQVRECTNRLVRLAKETGVAVFLVGHVTKEGSVAGPKVLEHMVDTVVEITGERTGVYRLLKTLKNRFGATDEVGVMLMDETGLVDVVNPAGIFLEESQVGQPGRAVVAVMEGTRMVLVEIQALAVKSNLPQPRRVVQGVSLAKVQVMLAVLTKWCGLKTGEYDVFVSVVGGMKLTEPGVDLAIALAVASSIMSKVIPDKTVVVGEVGLLGEVRTVAFLKKRMSEAKRLGYPLAIAPPAVKQIRQAIKSLT